MRIKPTCQQIGPVGYGHLLYYYYDIPVVYSTLYQCYTYKYLPRVVPQIAIKDEWLRRWWLLWGWKAMALLLQSLGPFPKRVVFSFGP